MMTSAAETSDGAVAQLCIVKIRTGMVHISRASPTIMAQRKLPHSTKSCHSLAPSIWACSNQFCGMASNADFRR